MDPTASITIGGGAALLNWVKLLRRLRWDDSGASAPSLRFRHGECVYAGQAEMARIERTALNGSSMPPFNTSPTSPRCKSGTAGLRENSAHGGGTHHALRLKLFLSPLRSSNRSSAPCRSTSTCNTPCSSVLPCLRPQNQGWSAWS